MMSTRTVIDQDGVYFITFTCFEWLPLIALSDAYVAVYKFFELLNAKGCRVVGYVIMPNHVHLLLYFKKEQKALHSLIGNGKRFLAYAIVKRLEQTNQIYLLDRLKMAVPGKDKERGKRHEIWKAGFDVKNCRTEKFLLQKLNYMHDNPVRGKWHLVKDRESYEHSSCLYYFHRQQGHCEVTHYVKVLDWENRYE
jgi:REP element-mobilizing transposase RayT